MSGVNHVAVRVLRRLSANPWPALGLMLAIAAAYWMYAGRDLSFVGDEWDFAYGRRVDGLEPFLRSHNEHPVITLVAYYKLMWSTVGLEDYWPYVAANVLVHLVAVVMVFELFRRRAGLVPAFASAAVLAFYGAGHDVVLWDFEIGFLLSVVAGTGAFMLMQRPGLVAGGVSGALLTFAIASASWGLVFAAVVGLAIVLRREWRRLPIALVPLALYALWSSRYGEGQFDLSRLPHVPRFVADAYAGTVANLAGVPLMWGRVLGGALLAVLVVWIWRNRSLSAIQFAALMLPLGAWVVTALARAGRDSPLAERFTWPFAVTALVATAYVLPRVRLSRAGHVVLALLVAGAVLSNLSTLRAATETKRGDTIGRLTSLGALDLARPSVGAAYVLAPLSSFGHFRADYYFGATDEFGSPGYNEAEILALPARYRLQADAQMLSAAPPDVAEGAVPANPAPTLPGRTPIDRPCIRLDPVADGPIDVTLPLVGIVVEPSRGEEVRAVYRRFADGYTPGRHTTVQGRTGLVPRPSRAATPWTVRLTAARPFRLCGGPERLVGN